MKQLIPKDKFDIKTAEKLIGYSYDQVQPIVPELLTWIQDMNWPVARPVADYLQSISENLSNDIVEILKGNDDQWKYWCIQIFGISSNKLPSKAVIEEIRRIADNPTRSEISEEVQERAIEFISGLKKNAP